MSDLPKKLQKRIDDRIEQDAFRVLKPYEASYDFSSNDYLGLGRKAPFYHEFQKSPQTGATGSRLLTGNHKAYKTLEDTLCGFHNSEAALMFNSGYDANLGLISAIGLRGDLILFDALAHASIRDGVQLAKAKALKFRHNDLAHLEQLLEQHAGGAAHCYVITESVFSMDGDSPDLTAIAALCQKHNAHLIVDEAHALGVIGARGEGLVQSLGLSQQVFARVITFGKALGYHGAAVLCSASLKAYLVNFARSLIYTTALPVAHIEELNRRYLWLGDSEEFKEAQGRLHSNILLLKSNLNKYINPSNFIAADAAIHAVIVKGNSRVRTVADQLLKESFGVLPILAPTVPKGEERIRICLHSYNDDTQIERLVKILSSFLQT